MGLIANHIEFMLLSYYIR